MRILVLTTSFPRWRNDSAASFIFDLHREMPGETHILAPHYAGAEMEETVDGLHIHRFRYWWPARWQRLCYGSGIMTNLRRRPWLVVQVPALLWAEYRAAARIVRRYRIELVHAHWILPQGFIASWVCRRRIPFLVTAHGDDVPTAARGMKAWCARWVLRRATGCTANSHATAGAVTAAVPDVSPTIIPMGVDPKLFQTHSNANIFADEFHHHGPTILFVGRLVEKKGVSYLLEAFARVLMQIPAVKLFIIGEGALHTALEERARTLHIANRVTFVGAIAHDELPAYYVGADVVVGPSTSHGFEGLGVVFIEALASGTPVVASRVGGVSDIVRDGETGLLVSERNPDELSRAILKVLSDDSLRARFIAQGRQHVRQTFSWGVIHRQLYSLYQQSITS